REKGRIWNRPWPPASHTNPAYTTSLAVAKAVSGGGIAAKETLGIVDVDGPTREDLAIILEDLGINVDVVLKPNNIDIAPDFGRIGLQHRVAQIAS
ncbi:hypothetical protein M8C21_010371, partial [Ambrosia artemisiifolia]